MHTQNPLPHFSGPVHLPGQHLSIAYSHQLNTIKIHGSVTSDPAILHQKVAGHVSTHLATSVHLFLHIRLGEASSTSMTFMTLLIDLLNAKNSEAKTIRLLWYVEKDSEELCTMGNELKTTCHFPFNVIRL